MVYRDWWDENWRLIIPPMIVLVAFIVLYCMISFNEKNMHNTPQTQPPVIADTVITEGGEDPAMEDNVVSNGGKESAPEQGGVPMTGG